MIFSSIEQKKVVQEKRLAKIDQNIGKTLYIFYHAINPKNRRGNFFRHQLENNCFCFFAFVILIIIKTMIVIAWWSSEHYDFDWGWDSSLLEFVFDKQSPGSNQRHNLSIKEILIIIKIIISVIAIFTDIAVIIIMIIISIVVIITNINIAIIMIKLVVIVFVVLRGLRDYHRGNFHQILLQTCIVIIIYYILQIAESSFKEIQIQKLFVINNSDFEWTKWDLVWYSANAKPEIPKNKSYSVEMKESWQENVAFKELLK